MVLKIDKYLDGLLVVYTHGGSEFFDEERLTDARKAAQVCRGSSPFHADVCACTACKIVDAARTQTALPARFLPYKQGEHAPA